MQRLLKGACALALVGMIASTALAQSKTRTHYKDIPADQAVNYLPRTGAGQQIYENVDARFWDWMGGDGSDGWWNYPGIGDDMEPAGTERTLVRYRYLACNNLPDAGSYSIDSVLWTSGVCPDCPACPWGNPLEVLPGSECTAILDRSGDPDPDVRVCEEVECKVDKATAPVLPDRLWFTLSPSVLPTDTDADGFFDLGPQTDIAEFAELGFTDMTMALQTDGDPEGNKVWYGCWWWGGDPYGGWYFKLWADPAGACCIKPLNDCVETSAANCANLGGQYVDDLSTCGPDLDGDGVVVRCDNCVGTANPLQEDCDGDKEGDACEPNPDDVDKDGDGSCNGVDPCPLDPDDDKDGDGDCADVDICPNDPDNDKDGDGQCGDVDPCPNDADDDKDGDGDCANVDICPNDPDNDKDGDGWCCFSGPGLEDECCNDPDKRLPGKCGCNVPDVDTDGDTVMDCNDICEGYNDLLDTDGDGVPDGCDDCPYDAPPEDTDGDGVCNSDDLCEGYDDNLDADQNQIPDCLENIPTVSTWGLVIMTLLLLTAWKVYFGRRAVA